LMARTSATDVLGSVLLVAGPEEYFAEREVAQVTAAVRKADHDADITEVAASEVGPGALAELTSPSLFATIRVVVVRGLQDLPEESVASLMSYADSPADDIALVLTHSGGQKGRSTVERLRRAGVSEVKADKLKRWELGRFVAAEARRLGAKMPEEAAEILVRSVGEDPRALAAAVEQLASDLDGEPITIEDVQRYFAGHAEVKGFAVADAALVGDTPLALEHLRWAIHNGVAPVLVTSAFASGLRALARFLSAPKGLREGDLARECAVQPWKLKDLRVQARGWTPAGMTAAIHAVARADADVKGATGDADYALERMVIAVGRAKTPV
jgi:DNA polymerase III subunit delta